MDSAEDAERQVVSPGLLRGIDVMQHNPVFELECSGWDAENEPPAKKRRLCLSLKKREPLGATNSQFASPTKQEVFEAAGEGVVPTNTGANTNWAVKTFKGGRIMIAFFVTYSTVAFSLHLPTLKRQQFFGAVANSLGKNPYFPLPLDVRRCVAPTGEEVDARQRGVK